MELYVTGFNAWGQLDFEHDTIDQGEADDIHGFTCALRARDIQSVRAFLSHTTLICDGATKTAGYSPRTHRALLASDPQAYLTLAEASNGSAATLGDDGTLRYFGSINHLLSEGLGQVLTDLPICKQVVAYDTGFAALSTSGSVYTWGDERYAACLGRRVSAHLPADKPGLVDALEDLPTGPISKIAAGGYTLAALTTGSDLYIWGGHHGRQPIPTNITDEPTPVVIEDHDIADVAVGDSHLITLTTQGDVFITGENRNGQLGLSDASTNLWRPIDLSLLAGRRVVGVAAGPRSSFIIIENQETP